METIYASLNIKVVDFIFMQWFINILQKTVFFSIAYSFHTDCRSSIQGINNIRLHSTITLVYNAHSNIYWTICIIQEFFCSVSTMIYILKYNAQANDSSIISWYTRSKIHKLVLSYLLQLESFNSVSPICYLGVVVPDEKFGRLVHTQTIEKHASALSAHERS